MELWGPYKWPLGLPGAHQQCVLPDVDANKFSGKKKHAEPEKGYISGIYSPPMNASHQKRTTLQNFSGPGIQKK